MYSFGKVSRERLNTCHWVLQSLAESIMAQQVMDFAIACGERNEEDQEKAFAEGASNAHYPESSHNTSPSLAFDIIPFPEKWSSDAAFDRLEKLVWKAWHRMPRWVKDVYDLRSGHDWDMDGIMNEDESNANELLQDRPHFELVQK